MKRLLIFGMLAVVIAGCASSSSEGEGTAKPGDGVATNPSGKPKDETAAQYSSNMEKTGAAMNEQHGKDAAAMAAARAAAGGK